MSAIIKYDDLPQEMKNLGYEGIIRTQSGKCYGMRMSPMWGRRLIECKDPEGMVLSSDELSKIQLIPNFPKIPANIWARIIKLYFHFNDPNNKTVDSRSEVSVRFSRRHDDPSVWRCAVPRQEVGGATVKASFITGMCDIETGETLDVWPPEGEFDAGSSHSHNTMGAYFSGIDDENELPCPGLHAVVGEINDKTLRYTVVASIVLDKRRLVVQPDDVMDLTPTKNITFHPNVLNFVKKYEYVVSKSTATTYPGHSQNYGLPSGGKGQEFWKPKADTWLERQKNQDDRWKKERERWESIHRKVLPVDGVIKMGQFRSACKRLDAIMEKLTADPDGLEMVKSVLKEYGFAPVAATPAPSEALEV